MPWAPAGNPISQVPWSRIVRRRRLAEIAMAALKKADSHWAEIRSGKVTYRIVGMPDRDFPKVPDHREASYATVESAVLREMIERTMFSVCNDETRFHLNGVFFESDGSKCRMVSTDGHRLSKVERTIPNFEALNLPPIIEQLCHFDQGMVLLAGVTGCGKSTTIAAMLDYVNHHEHVHILTIEDPIEFVYEEDKALINQREIGVDVKDFAIAMKHAVREDPDIMLVGEMRDMETFETAMHAAETGHLVFGTLHASSAASAVGRILDLFPRAMHPALRSSMGFNLKAIIAQKLLPTVLENPQRVPIVEIMIFNPTIRKLILEEKDDKLVDAMRIGRGEGMQLFNDSLSFFAKKEWISRGTALEASPNAEQLNMMLKGIDVTGAGIL